MTDRLDRHFQNLKFTEAFEAVLLIRRKCVELHRGPEDLAFHSEAEYMTTAIVLKTGKTSCNRGRDHICNFQVGLKLKKAIVFPENGCCPNNLFSTRRNNGRH
jgi:hypothetical protein